MINKVFNKYEEITYDSLKNICSKVGAHVFPKVRIADVISLNNSGISPNDFSYGLLAHFDFTITDRNYKALFSVEFDGPLHTTSSKQKLRDQRKNRICEHFGYSLLRINSNYINKKFRGMDLISYFIDSYFLANAFNKAQNDGFIPLDEMFDISLIYSNGNSKNKFPYWLSLDSKILIQKLFEDKIINQPSPSFVVGKDDNEIYRCLLWIALDNQKIVYTITGMHTQNFSCVCQSDLISMIGMFDLYEKLKSTIEGGKNYAIPKETFFINYLKEFQKYKMVYAHSCGPT